MKKTATTAIKVLVSVGLYVYIFSKVDVEHLWSIVKEANVSYFILALVVYAGVQAISAYRWYLLLQPLGMKIKYPKLLSFYFLGMYFNFFLPTAIGGDVVRVYYLNKETKRLSGSTASVFLDRDLGMAALLLMATVVSTIGGTRFNGVPLAPIFGAIGVAFIAANLALFYRPTYNLLHRLLSVFKLKKADERVEHLFESVNSYRGQAGLLSGAMILSLIVQVGCVFVNVLAADSIGLTTANGWVDFLVFIPAIGLISMVPVSLNGMGWREISYIGLFQSVGASKPQALTLALMWLAILVTTSLPGGIIYIVRSLKGKEGPPKPEEVLEAEAFESQARDDGKFSPLTGQKAEEEPASTI
ncbi:MAG TPA: lysylphosphatidylglycerol synthase transmembrane domain-containing protein [Blastocatellia bacterium]|nr:lysylphosphatidylglycerol synthase transmembrane domain-containing protein [Blastocatellia bacterium]